MVPKGKNKVKIRQIPHCTASKLLPTMAQKKRSHEINCTAEGKIISVPMSDCVLYKTFNKLKISCANKDILNKNCKSCPTNS